MQETRHLSIDQALAQEIHRKQLKLASELLLPKARKRERWAALNLLELCSDAIADRCAIEGSIGDWLSRALKRLAEGDSIEEALEIPARRVGKKKEGAARRDAARRVQWAYEVEVELHNGSSQGEAWNTVALRHGLKDKEDTVRKAWKDHRASVKREIELRLKYFGKP